MINYSIIFHLIFVFRLISLTQARHNKAISRDTWSQLLEFARVRYKALIHATGSLFQDAMPTIHLHLHVINIVKHVHVMCYLPSPHLLLFSSFLGLCIKRNICLQMQRTSERILTSFVDFFFLFSFSFFIYSLFQDREHIYYIILAFFAKAFISDTFHSLIPILAAICFPHSYRPRINNPIHSFISFSASYLLENNDAALIGSPY